MSTILASIAVAALLWISSSTFISLAPSAAGAAARPAGPSLTVIRPIRGLDVGADGNVRALLGSDYPAALELLFVFDEASDPAVPLVRDAGGAARPDVERARAVRRRAAARPHRQATRDAVGVREGDGELIAFSDSDTRVDRDLLRVLVDELVAWPGAGDVFAPALADAPRTRPATSAMRSCSTSGMARSPPPRRCVPQLPFIMGQLMVFRSEALAAIGGVESADGQLVDDMYLGRRMAAPAGTT